MREINDRRKYEMIFLRHYHLNMKRRHLHSSHNNRNLQNRIVKVLRSYIFGHKLFRLPLHNMRSPSLEHTSYKETQKAHRPYQSHEHQNLYTDF